MNILLLDIETSPNTAYVWGIWNENIPIARLIDHSHLLCWSAKWLGEDTEVIFNRSDTMLVELHHLLDKADIVVTYNGNRFDIPVVNKEFLLNRMNPPSPYKSVDLYKVVKNKFRFTSNKLDYVSSQLGIGNKHDTTFELWVKCMEGDKVAWEYMEKYNKQDVLLLEKLYYRLLPWSKFPLIYSSVDELTCPHCNNKNVQKRGKSLTKSMTYQRYQCMNCGTWFRKVKGEGIVSTENRTVPL